MVLLKRLLLPGKGAVISCILILLNVLCGEPVCLVKASRNTALVRSLFLLPFSFDYFSPNSYSQYGAVLATLSCICFQIPPSYAAETTLAVLNSQDHTQSPVLNKTDPLATTKWVGEGDDLKIIIHSRRSRSSKSSLHLQNVSSNDTRHSDKVMRNTLLKLEMLSTENKTTVPTNGSSDTLFMRKKRRKPKLLKEITLLNRQNCLAKLLCGVQVAQPPTKSSSAVNDYAYLVKSFFDRFSIKGLVTEALDAAFTYETDSLDPLDDEDDLDGGSKKKRKKKRKKTKLENYKPKYYDDYDKNLQELVDDMDVLEDDDLPDFYHDYFRRRSGRNMTFVAPHISNNCSSNTTKMRKEYDVKNDVNKIRTKRGILGRVRRGFMGFFNPRFDKTSYLNKRQLELETTENQGRQFNIAEEIAARIRSPRQCRLLNWFGTKDNANNNNNANTPAQQGMTTTITTITNTGGMMGSGLERLGGNIPQAAMNSGGTGNSGSQVITVVQQSPMGAASNNNPIMGQLPTAATTTSSIRNTASNMASEASSIASTIGSTICPFNTQELRALIQKAQNSPFPHFLTTTPPAPTRAVPLSTSTTSTTTTTTQKATQAPPPPSTTLAVVVRQAPGNSRHSPQNYVNFYGNFDPHLQPLSTPYLSYKPFAQLVPTVGVVGDDDEGEFEDDPYVTYERKNLLDKHHTSTLRRNVKLVPKWMTTTPTPRDDDYYVFNDAMPNYSYGGYKVEKKHTAPARYILEPPIVVDSGRRYKPQSNERAQLQVPKATSASSPPSQNTPTQKTHTPTESEEDSNENDDGSSDEGSDDDDDGSDEVITTSSDSRESISTFNNNMIQMQRQYAPPISAPRPPPRSVEVSEEDDDSNEAEEKKENDDDDEEGSEEDESHGLRSFERSDFSKDRGGPPPPPSASSATTTTTKPSRQENSNNVGTGVSGFLSNFFGSINPLNSLFRKDYKKISSPTPIPSRPLLEMSALSDESEVEDDNENEEESEEDEEEDGNHGMNEEPKSGSDTPSSSFYPWSTRQLSATALTKTTRAPIVIEESGSWAERYKDSTVPDDKSYKDQEDESESGEDGVVFDNPVENYRISHRKLHLQNEIEKRWTARAN